MSTNEAVNPTFAYIPLDRLAPNEYNARRFTENMTPQRLARFNELTASIREKGIIEPLLVRPIGLDRFEIIAGERRFRAALQVVETAGTPMEEYLVPCMVREVGDDAAFDLMIIENMQRDDLTPLETAQAFAAYLGRHGNTTGSVAELSIRTGIPAHAIRRQVRLLEVPTEVIAAWKDDIISQTHVELFTRVGDMQQVLELLDACRRSKLSTRDLAERIGAASPDLERGFFDKEGCQVCHFNTSVQSGLFSDITPGGKCCNPGCFEAKQGEFLSVNWLQSKAAGMFGTRGFRFGHRLGQARCEPIILEPAERCQTCDTFVTILRLTGAVVSGYARSCAGPLACFEELYRNSPASAQDETPEEQPVAQPVDEQPEDSGKVAQAPAKTPKAVSPAKPADKKPAAPPPEETGPVYDIARGIKYREAFYRQAIPAACRELGSSDDSRNMRLALLAMVLSTPTAKLRLIESQKYPDAIRTEQLAGKIFDDIPVDDIPGLLGDIALIKILDATVQPDMRRIVAENFLIKLGDDWQFTKEYLNELSKSEIVRIGEEPGVGIWQSPAAEAYRKRKHKGKALLSLKKEELIDIILKSGADLAGRIPEEVLGTRG